VGGGAAQLSQRSMPHSNCCVSSDVRMVQKEWVDTRKLLAGFAVDALSRAPERSMAGDNRSVLNRMIEW